jgi:hypothetical protein
MRNLRYGARTAATLVLLLTVAGCSGAGNIGEVLGGVLGGAGQTQGSQVSGVVLGVDQNRQQLGIQLQDGQQVALLYDQQTQVVYQNQRYAVTNLERGDRITARIQQTQNGGYYTDLVQVDQSVSTSGGAGGSANVQSIQGTVRQVDFQNGLFSLDVNGYGTLIVALPYNVSRADQNTFQQLRQGDRVRLYGVFLNNQRVELRQFY